jgi:DNA-directed RNA polymerase subunit RPC12/RpoP
MRIDAYPKPISCPYCTGKVIYTSNAEIYGKEYGNGRCYKCVNCDAYVGVHDGTDIPLGRLANKELRELKKQCHTLFDPVWKQHKSIKRKQTYEQLAIALEIPIRECHFGWFDKDMLLKAKQILAEPNWYKGQVKQ